MVNLLKVFHNQGQADASDGDFSSPDTITHSIEEITAYYQGYFSTRGQIDGSENNYDPPSFDDLGAREIYDEAWEAAYENREE